MLLATVSAAPAASHEKANAQENGTAQDDRTGQNDGAPLEHGPPAADPSWLTWCVSAPGGNGTLDDARCYVQYEEALAKDQAAVLGHIRAILAKPGPAGTDYKQAATDLATAQDHWRAYVEAQCSVIGDVFGYGTALGLAGAECTIGHFETRNEELRDLEKSYLQF